jgi:hypothetical protein
MDQDKLDQIGEVIFKQLGLKEEMSLKFISTALQAIKTFDENHTEKGLEPYTEYGPIGVMIEFDKKRNKLRNHYHPLSEEKYDSEVIEKTWKDAAVYALMGLLVETGDWDNK